VPLLEARAAVALSAVAPKSITYLVTLDGDARRWTVTRQGVATGGFARDKSTAIGLAYREASLEQAGTDLDVTVWSVQNGKRQKEWPTA
jgi:hypothetical protein